MCMLYASAVHASLPLLAGQRPPIQATVAPRLLLAHDRRLRLGALQPCTRGVHYLTGARPLWPLFSASKAATASRAGPRSKVYATAAAAPPPAPPRRPRATLRDLFDSKGVVVSAFDTRLVLMIFSNNEMEAVRVTEFAWQWCIDRGLSRRDIERLLRHFQHCNRYPAFALFETTSCRNWLLFDKYLAAFAQHQRQSPATEVPNGYAGMLAGSRQGLERVAEMLTVPPQELEAFLEVISQRLGEAAAGGFVAQMPQIDPLHFQPSTAVAESLVWISQSLPVGSGQGTDWPALLRFVSKERALLQESAAGLQQQLGALQQAAGMAAQQVAALAYSQPQLLSAGDAAIQQAGTVLQLWTSVVGVPLDTCLAQFRRAVNTGRSLLALAEPELLQRLATLQEAVGATAQQAALVAFAQPELLQAAQAAPLQQAAARLRQLVPPAELAAMLEQHPEQLASSLWDFQEVEAVMRQWTEVLGLPYAPHMAQRSSPWFRTARWLLGLADSELQLRMATLQQAAGEQAVALALAAPQVLDVPRTAVEGLAGRLHQFLSPGQLGQLLTEDPGLLVAPSVRLHHLEAALRLWTQVLGVPADMCVGQYHSCLDGASELLHYKESTLQRRMAAVRQAAGMGAEQVAALLLAHPDLLQKQHTLVREAGEWLQRQELLPEELTQLVQCDPGLLGSSLWAVKETFAKLRLWTEVVGVPREACLAHYGACVSEPMLPDLAATYILVQERAPDLLRGPDGNGSLEWWLDKRLLLERAGLNESAAARMLEHWIDSESGKQLLAQLRAGSTEGWPLPGVRTPPAQPASGPTASMLTGSSRAGRAGARSLHSQRTEMDQYNMNRIKSMSESQLRIRIRKIKNPSKLRSFVKELEECGLTELAAEARAALEAL